LGIEDAPVILSAQSVEDLKTVAKAIVTKSADKKIIVFNGEMGSGKTTLIKAICQALGCKDEASSPTYSIVNEYHGDQLIYHFDLYRIKDEDELIDIGFSDYTDSEAYCLIEWPELAIPYLEDYLTVDISIDELGARNIKFG